MTDSNRIHNFSFLSIRLIKTNKLSPKNNMWALNLFYFSYYYFLVCCLLLDGVRKVFLQFDVSAIWRIFPSVSERMV